MRTNVRPRGSPRVRLVSSVAMLLVVAAGVAFYSVRKTSDLIGIGVSAHVHCALEATAEGSDTQFDPLIHAILDAAGADYTVVSAHPCTVSGRDHFDIILRRGQTPVSVVVTKRREQEVFPRALFARVVDAAGTPLHMGSRDGYAVAAFESGAYLGYVVSALPASRNSELAVRIVPAIVKILPSVAAL